MKVRHLYRSSRHHYRGPRGEAVGGVGMEEVDWLCCVAGRGVEGDRYFDYKPGFKGQITFFDLGVYLDLCEEYGVFDKDPGVFRRNVVVEGVDLTRLTGCDFEVQGVRFAGTEEADPCRWMDEAFFPGALRALAGQGGLRARILSDGILRREEREEGSSK